MIEVMTRTVYRLSSNGRCYLTKKAAIGAAARALIEAKHPTEWSEFYDSNGHPTDAGSHWTFLKRSDVLYRRVCKLIKNNLNLARVA